MRIVIDKTEINYFTNITLTLKLDSIASTFEFATYYQPQDLEYQRIFKPLQYKDVEIYNSKDKLIFTGTILNHRFTSNKGRELVIISGYSKCGILEDVCVPPSQYPLENNKKSLKDIATQLCGYFGINVVVSDQSKSISESTTTAKVKNVTPQSDFATLQAKSKQVFGRTAASPTETIREYIAKLASQKNIVLSHNEKGEVLLFQPDYMQVPRVKLGKENTLSMTIDYNGQGLHSDINIVRQPSDENAGLSTADVAKNTLVNKYRPTTKILSSGDDAQIEDAAKNELAAELKAINLSIELQGLFDEIYPGEIINVHNHYIYCYAYNRFMVDSITMKLDSKSETTTLNCVVPETFTGGPLIRNILFNHWDKDFRREPHLNGIDNNYLQNPNYESDKEIL
jgi:prophage tail gpP-like protein